MAVQSENAETSLHVDVVHSGLDLGNNDNEMRSPIEGVSV
jgi:hypothetical protein